MVVGQSHYSVGKKYCSGRVDREKVGAKKNKTSKCNGVSYLDLDEQLKLDSCIKTLMLYDGINHRFHIKERKALILIPAILSLVSGMVISFPYEAFAQPANMITGSGSQMITQEQRAIIFGLIFLPI